MGGHHAPNRQNGSAGYSLKKVEQVKQFQWKDCVLYVEETHVLLEENPMIWMTQVIQENLCAEKWRICCVKKRQSTQTEYIFEVFPGSTQLNHNRVSGKAIMPRTRIFGQFTPPVFHTD